MLVYERETSNIIAANKSACKLYGYSEEEILTLNFNDLKAKNSSNNLFRQEYDNKNVYTDIGIWLHQKKGGEQFYLQTMAYPIKYEGKACKWVVAQNVSETDDHQKIIGNEQELFEVLTKNYPGIFYIFDKNGKIERWNKRVEKVTGYSSSEIKQMSPLGFIASSEHKKVQEKLKEAFKQEGNEVETLLKTKEGKEIPYYFKASKAYLQGEPHLIGIGVDISTLQNVRNELELLYQKEKEERARIESINSRLKLLNSVSNIFARQPQAEKALNKIAELLITEVSDISSIYLLKGDEPVRIAHKVISEDVEELTERVSKEYPGIMYNINLFKQVIKTGEPVYQNNFTKDDLERLSLEKGAKQLLNELGINSYYLLPLKVGDRVIGVLSLIIVSKSRQFYIDDRNFLLELADKIALHTQNAKIEEDLRNLNATLEEKVKTRTKQLEEANKELESFSYSVSHDLRAPLRAIAGYSNLLIDDHQQNLDEEGQQFLQIVHDETNRMGELIDELLAFSRMSRTQKNEMQISMKDLVYDSIQEIQYSYPNEDPSFEVANLPEVVIDPKLMKQVWLNLLGNAIKYKVKNQQQRIKINSFFDEETDSYVFSVSDNGVGFDMKYEEKLFGVFQRLHSEEEFEGTGIGLALAQRIVKRHGGRMWAESSLGEGSTFYFSLPIDTSTDK